AHQELLDRLEVWFDRIEDVLERRPGPHEAHRLELSSASERNSFNATSEYVEEVAKQASVLAVNHSLHTLPSGLTVNQAATTKTSPADEYAQAKEQGSRMESFKQYVSSSQVASKPQGRVAQGLECIQQSAAYLADSLAFNVFFAIVIFSNSVFLGMQLEWSALKVDKFVEPAFLVAHMVYAVLFTLEMSVRVAAVGVRSYFFGQSWAWNWLDVVVVVPAWVELAMDFAMRGGTEGTGTSNFRIIRVFKITRLLQVVRSLRIVRFIGALRALVMSVVDTTRQLIWALILLALVIYSFAILFTDACQDHMFRNGRVDSMDEHFGSVYASSTTLFQSILAGMDWKVAADSLLPLGIFWVQLFNLYIAFCGFAVLNVMTGVFVNSAIKTREKDHETMMQNVQRFKDLVAKVWKKIDVSGLGQLTISEFEQIFKDEDMMAFFDAIEINAVDAWTLFDSLDADRDHLVSYEEFSTRCMQLHGPARSVDLFALKSQQDKMWNQLKSLETISEASAVQIGMLLRVVATERTGQRMDPGSSTWGV
ncbi:Catsper1, partial [Symbiodinium sp. CCMP2456]